jgi:mono/diheme cytochrome c family protein
MKRTTKHTVTGTIILGLLATTLTWAAEKDPMKPRVPEGERAAAQKMKNPVASSPETIAKGKAVYEGKGTCIKCHGPVGAGDGPFGKNLKPSPRTLTNSEWQKSRTDGELFWIIKNGSPGTGMVSLIPSDINEDDAWHEIHYVRTLAAN